MGNCASENSTAVVVTTQRNDDLKDGAIKRNNKVQPKISDRNDDHNDNLTVAVSGIIASATTSLTSEESSTTNNIEGNKSFLNEKINSREDLSTFTKLQHKEHGDSVLYITSAISSFSPMPFASESLQTDKMYPKAAREVNIEVNDVDINSRDSISKPLTIEGESSVKDKLDESIMEVKILQGKVRDENTSSCVNLEVEGVSEMGKTHQEDTAVEITDARSYDYEETLESAPTTVIGAEVLEDIINDEEKKYDSVDGLEITDTRSHDYGETLESVPTTVIDADILEKTINDEEKSYDTVDDELSTNTSEPIAGLILLCEAVSPGLDRKLVTLDDSKSTQSKASDNLSLLNDIPSPTCSFDRSLAESSHNTMQYDYVEEQPENSLSIPVSMKNAFAFQEVSPSTAPLQSLSTDGDPLEILAKTLTGKNAVMVEMSVEKSMMEEEGTETFQRAKSPPKMTPVMTKLAKEKPMDVKLPLLKSTSLTRGTNMQVGSVKVLSQISTNPTRFEEEDLVKLGGTEEKSTISDLLSELMSLSSAFAETRSSSPAACDKPTKPKACMSSQLELAIDYENKQQSSHRAIVHPIQVSTRKSKLQRPSTKTLLSVGKRKLLNSDTVKSCLSRSQQKLFERSSITSKIPLLKKSSARAAESPYQWENNTRTSAIPKIKFHTLSRKSSPYKTSTRVCLIPSIS